MVAAFDRSAAELRDLLPMPATNSSAGSGISSESPITYSQEPGLRVAWLGPAAN